MLLLLSVHNLGWNTVGTVKYYAVVWLSDATAARPAGLYCVEGLPSKLAHLLLPTAVVYV